MKPVPCVVPYPGWVFRGANCRHAVLHNGPINGGTAWSALRRLVMDAFQHCFNTGDIFEEPLMSGVQMGEETGHGIGIRVIAMEMLCS